MRIDNNIQAFFELLRAGLWGDADINLNVNLNEKIDWWKVYQLATEQSVQGPALAGIERYKNLNANLNLNQIVLLQWIGEVQLIEQRNKAMNVFVAKLIEKLRKHDVYAILVKGQGVAQCYEKPLWRACGDVDFLLSNDNYEETKKYLCPLANMVEEEGEYQKHLSLTIDSWVVELHGTLRTGLSPKIDRVIDETQRDVFYGGNVRSWMNGKTQVFLPGLNDDVIFVFTHFLKHFYKGGLGLRQVCDWCRLLYTCKDSLNHGLLESRIRKMGLMTEWKAFAAMAVDYLGMPAEAMPLYSSEKKWSRKGDKICAFVLEVGNFGHNRDNSYYAKHPFLIRKIYSFGRRCGDLFRHVRIFPLDSLRFFPYMMMNGIKAALNGVHND